MDDLLKVIKESDAIIRPANQEDIENLKKELGFNLSGEYEKYLSTCGVIIYESWETYGLGVNDNSYLNVFNAYKDLSSDSEYPDDAVPLVEIGDGSYYLYDNASEMVLLWSTPNGGVVRTLHENLESFFIKFIFNQD